MFEIIEQAHAKINLTLDVLRRRPDGYHEVEMIMQTLELADTVVLEHAEQGIQLATASTEIPLGPDNLAWKAAELMSDTFAHRKGLKISIEKRIPVAAGLAGGSSDAAAVMRGINRLWELGLPIERLCELGARLGSDVPFCLWQGTALASGRGEIISPLVACPELWLVLVKPPEGVSTAEVYGKFNQSKVDVRPNTAKLVQALKQSDKAGIISSICNVLETVTLVLVPEVARIKEKLLAAGAVNAQMSGSGPTVFGIAKSQDHADALAQMFNSKEYTTIVTKTFQ